MEPSVNLFLRSARNRAKCSILLGGCLSKNTICWLPRAELAGTLTPHNPDSLIVLLIWLKGRRYAGELLGTTRRTMKWENLVVFHGVIRIRDIPLLCAREGRSVDSTSSPVVEDMNL